MHYKNTQQNGTGGQLQAVISQWTSHATRLSTEAGYTTVSETRQGPVSKNRSTQLFPTGLATQFITGQSSAPLPAGSLPLPESPVPGAGLPTPSIFGTVSEGPSHDGLNL